MRGKLLAFVGMFCVLLAGTGCSLKYGKYNVSDSATDELIEKKDYVAAEIDVKQFFGDKVNLSLGAGFMLDPASSGELSTNHGTISEADLDFFDIYTTVRYYPFGMKMKKSPIFFHPYIGAGVGYYKMKSNFRSKGDYVYSDYFYDYYEIDEDTDTLAKGFNPHIVGGLAIPIGKKWSVFIDDRYEINRKDGKIDMSGNILMFGFKFGY